MASRVLQQLLDAHYPAFAQTHPLPDHVRAAGHCLRSCRTAALVRQAKLGASCQVQVLAEEGLTNHSYRVLQLWRRQRCNAEQDS